jgi:predicted enzyme related to lactoylglutathione lyase
VSSANCNNVVSEADERLAQKFGMWCVLEKKSGVIENRGPLLSLELIRLEGENTMKIKWTTLYVNDQEKALKFYTDVLGFKKKADFSQGPYRWLTVVSPEESDGTEVILEANTNPAAKAFQEAMHASQMRAAQFMVSDVQAEHDRLAAKGVKFTMPVTKVTGANIAVLDDTCGNLLQLIQPAW